MKNRSILQWSRTQRLAVNCVALAMLSCLAGPVAVHAQTLTTLQSFNGTNGAFPSTTLAQLVRTHHWVQHPNGNFYGTTAYGGTTPTAGTVYQVTPSGALTAIYNFCSLVSNNICTDGQTPQAALVVGSDGNLYGTTYLGGANNAGTVFKITTGGALTTLYSFKGTTDGANPLGALAQDNRGNFWGTTYNGGNANNAGTLFKITPGGSLTTLYTFCSKAGCADGANPQGDLVQASGWDSDGNFYGNTYAGGNSNNAGTMFVITPAGALTTLYTFCSNTNCTDGANPNVPMVQDAFGNLYGTTKSNGANAGGTLFVVFPWGQLRTLYHFCSNVNCTDGANPTGGPLLGQEGYIYGTTYGGGSTGNGTIYQITPWGVLATLHNFCTQANCPDGQNPEASLVQASNGYFYSTTSFGGAFGLGTVFSLSPPDPSSGNACNGVYYGTFFGNITVRQGQTCEFTDDGVVAGNIYVTGGSLILNNASVLGNVEIDGGTYALGPSLTIYSNVQVQNIASGSAQNTICGATVRGDLQLQNNGTAVEIGSTTGACPGNTVGGNLQVNNNTALVQVFENTILNNLQCQNNTSITGGANTAKRKQGQCSSF